MSFYHKVNQEKSYRRGIFLFVSLALAGACSICPMMCFKNYSSKERAKLNNKVADLDRRHQEDEEEGHRPRLTCHILTLTDGVTARRDIQVATQTIAGAGEIPTRISSWTQHVAAIDGIPAGTLTTGIWIKSVEGATTAIRRRAVTTTAPRRASWAQCRRTNSEGNSGVWRTDCRSSYVHSYTVSLFAFTFLVYSVHIMFSTTRDNADNAYRHEVNFPFTRRTSPDESPPKRPSTGSSSQTAGSETSHISKASSFAHLLRNNRGDWRLLTKGSQPLQHLTQRPPLSRKKPVEIKRTPSYYAPKVVEDTAMLPSPMLSPRELRTSLSLTAADFINAVHRSPIDSTKPLMPRSISPARPSARPLRKSHSSTSQARSNSTDPPISPLTPPASLRRPGLRKWPNLQDTSRSSPLSPPRQVRIETPPRPRSLVGEAGPEHSRSNPWLPRSSAVAPRPSKSDTSLGVRQYHDITPPEAEPTSPELAGVRHGDHYFRTFGPDIMFSKDLTLGSIPTAPSSPIAAEMMPSPSPFRLIPARRTSDSVTQSASRRKRNSIFNAFQRSALTDSTYEAPNSGIVGTAAQIRSPPGILVSGPQEHRLHSRRSSMFSNILLPPYFAQPRQRDTPSDAMSSMVSPMSTSGEKGLRPGLHHSRSSTDDSSPRTLPRSRPRLRHSHTLENIEDSELPAVLPNAAMVQAVPSGGAAGPQHSLKSYGMEDYKAMFTGSSGPKRLLWGMKQGKMPSKKQSRPAAEGMKRSVLKQFFLDLRIGSPDHTQADSKTTNPDTTQHRAGLAHASSMVTLLQKVSKPQLNKLKRKASQTTISTVRPGTSLSKHSLEVTEFHQTPFSQRYGNARRAEMSQIRSYLAEALNSDDDTDIPLDFEFDVPDHLPSSPLCPLNPKHKSGGRAICLLHGRKKPHQANISRAATKIEPKIVYEGKTEGVVDAGPRIVYESKPEDMVESSRRRSEERDETKRLKLSQAYGDGAWYY